MVKLFTNKKAAQKAAKIINDSHQQQKGERLTCSVAHVMTLGRARHTVLVLTCIDSPRYKMGHEFRVHSLSVGKSYVTKGPDLESALESYIGYLLTTSSIVPTNKRK